MLLLLSLAAGGLGSPKGVGAAEQSAQGNVEVGESESRASNYCCTFLEARLKVLFFFQRQPWPDLSLHRHPHSSYKTTMWLKGVRGQKVVKRVKLLGLCNPQTWHLGAHLQK